MDMTEAKTAIDPVCGMTVDPMRASRLTRMAATPIISAPTAAASNSPPTLSAISTSAASAKPLPQGTLYTCPMHPQIVQEGPGPLPDLRHGARADGRAAGTRARRQPGAHRLHAQAVGRRAAVARARRPGHGRACVRRRSAAIPRAAGPAMAEARPRCRRRCCGAAGRSSCAASPRSARAGSTCSR